jgi:hypothetical protein
VTAAVDVEDWQSRAMRKDIYLALLMLCETEYSIDGSAYIPRVVRKLRASPHPVLDMPVQGVPVRVEVGPRDVASSSCVVSRRDRPGKEGKTFGVSAEPAAFVQHVSDLLEDIQVWETDLVLDRHVAAATCMAETTAVILATAAPMQYSGSVEALILETIQMRVCLHSDFTRTARQHRSCRRASLRRHENSGTRTSWMWRPLMSSRTPYRRASGHGAHGQVRTGRRSWPPSFQILQKCMWLWRTAQHTAHDDFVCSALHKPLNIWCARLPAFAR